MRNYSRAPRAERRWEHASVVQVEEHIALILPVPPTGNRAVRHVRNGRHYVPAEVADYYRSCQLFGRARRIEPIRDGEVVVSIAWYRSRKAGDIDGRTKVLLDALQGIAYTNDRQVAELHITRHDGDHEARIEVRVWRRLAAQEAA